MADWQVEQSGDVLILVVLRHRKHGPQQDLARDERGRIIWFENREEAQAHADRLNESLANSMTPTPEARRE